MNHVQSSRRRLFRVSIILVALAVPLASMMTASLYFLENGDVLFRTRSKANGAVDDDGIVRNGTSVGGTVVDDDDSTRINRWHRRLAAGRGVYVFFKHIRKAGGTSLRKYLRRVLAFHNRSSHERVKDGKLLYYNRSRALFYEQEFAAMHWRCPELDAGRWNDTLSVVALRHPLERHLSEFFYSGYGPTADRGPDMRRLRKLYNARNYSFEFYRLLAATLPPWMEQGRREIRQAGYLGRHFSDYFQVRALSGETDELPFPRPTNCSIRNDTEVCKSHRRSPPCFYGTGNMWGGGTPAFQNMTEIALARAKKVLDEFDIVLLTETMGAQAEFLAYAFRVPLDVASIADDNLNVKDAEGKGDILSGMRTMIPTTLELLRNQSNLEMLLYDHAVRINGNLLEKWRLEKSM